MQIPCVKVVVYAQWCNSYARSSYGCESFWFLPLISVAFVIVTLSVSSCHYPIGQFCCTGIPKWRSCV